MLRNRIRNSNNSKRQMTADEVINCKCAAAISHPGHGNTENLFQFRAGEMRNGSVARNAKCRLVGMSLEPRHKLLEIGDIYRGAGDNAELETRELRDRHKILVQVKLGSVSTIGSRYIVGPVVTRTVVPSGLAF